MITNVSLLTVYCLDQDESRDFYTGILGFEVRTDITMGEGFRWLTIGHPSQPELEATLMLPGPPLDDEAADLVTEMTLIKHHFAAGVKAQEGIEF